VASLGLDTEQAVSLLNKRAFFLFADGGHDSWDFSEDAFADVALPKSLNDLSQVINLCLVFK